MQFTLKDGKNIYFFNFTKSFYIILFILHKVEINFFFTLEKLGLDFSTAI